MATSIRRTTTTARTGSLSVVSQNSFQDTLLTDLFAAYYQARSNKRNTHSQVRFEMNLSDNLIALYNEIRERRYKVGRSMCFIINDPVKREVFAASFRDRVVHHLLFNYLSPIFERYFIYDSYSCRKGKGTHFGVERLDHHIRSCSNNYSIPCYILKLDIQGYFMSIDRTILYELITDKLSDSESLDKDLVEYLLKEIIFNDPTKGCRIKGHRSDWIGLPPSKSLFYSHSGCGLPIGNLTSQLFSNIYLSVLDDYITKTLGFKHYGRYVDDFYIISNNKDRLLDAIPQIRLFLDNKLHLSLHSHKVYLQECHKGVRFLGKFMRPFCISKSTSSAIRINYHINKALTFVENPYITNSVLASCAI